VGWGGGTKFVWWKGGHDLGFMRSFQWTAAKKEQFTYLKNTFISI